MNDDFLFERETTRTPPKFPIGVRVAGIIWIVFGSLGLLGVVVDVVLSGVAAADGGPNTRGGGSVCCSGLLSGLFLWLGIQTVRGTAKDTLWSSIGSFVFSVIYAVLGIGALFAAMAVNQINNQPPGPGRAGAPAMAPIAGILFALLGVMALLLAVMMFAAGLLGLLGRSQYSLWREKKRNEPAA
ncbi:hypothetical protein [Fimbriiglobus ruber]|uniref:hypothetical protein n=1 Tax=Fimbriiglobus ruber TaxID=1908690 RepID=UPI000B4B8FF3|nr:hypothetical protein [Fimbriiglobus ruber]